MDRGGAASESGWTFGRCRRCCVLRGTAVGGRPSQRRHLSGVPPQRRLGVTGFDWLIGLLIWRRRRTEGDSNKKTHQLVKPCEMHCDTYPRATVVYNTYYHLFRKRLCTSMYLFAFATWKRQQYKHSHLGKAGPLEPHFGVKKQKLSNGLQHTKWRTWITLSKTVKLFEINCVIISRNKPSSDRVTLPRLRFDAVDIRATTNTFNNNKFLIGWTIIEKSLLQHDPQMDTFVQFATDRK